MFQNFCRIPVRVRTTLELSAGGLPARINGITGLSGVQCGTTVSLGLLYCLVHYHSFGYKPILPFHDHDATGTCISRGPRLHEEIGQFLYHVPSTA